MSAASSAARRSAAVQRLTSRVDDDGGQPAVVLGVVGAAEDAHTRLVGEERPIALTPAASPLHHVVQPRELGAAERREDVGEAVVVADLGVLVVRDGLTRLGGELADVIRQPPIVRSAACRHRRWS